MIVHALKKVDLYKILGNGLLAFGLVGFSIVGSISGILLVEGNYLSILYRITYLLFCGLLVARSFYLKTYRFDFLMIVFFSIYSLRILADYNYSFLPNISDDATFYLGTVLLPVLCLGGGRRWYNERIALWFIAGVGTIGNILTVYAMRADLMAGIVIDPNVETRASLASLNSISIGYNGVFTAAAATMLLLQVRNTMWRAVFISAIILSAYLTISAASRGPIIALFFGMAVTGLGNKRARIGLTLASLAGAAIIAFTGLPELLFERFVSAGTDASSVDRVYAQGLSIDAALANPWFGDAYIEPVTGIYPHNLLIESALALGIAGLLVMSWLMISMVVNSVRAATEGEMLLPFIAVAQFVNAWISAALWSSFAFYMVLWLIRDRRSDVPREPNASAALL